MATAFAPDPELSKQVVEVWEKLNDTTPLVQCLTNTVVQPVTANVLMAGGCAPAMIDIEGEAGVFASIASAVLVNLGTLAPSQQIAIPEATAAALGAGTPWVLDPVGIGALPVRTKLAQDLLRDKPSVVRGNASEIIALAGGIGGRGVDSTASVDEAREAATRIAREVGTVVATSGEIDFITDGERSIECANGDPMLTLVTGMGCSLGAYIAAFTSVSEDALIAAATAHACFGLAAQRAVEQSSGPGTFSVFFLDELANLTPETLLEGVRLR